MAPTSAATQFDHVARDYLLTNPEGGATCNREEGRSGEAWSIRVRKGEVIESGGNKHQELGALGGRSEIVAQLDCRVHSPTLSL